ncbi:hypothetical protein OKW40_001111 [Paraburkholderia sp. RAU6.4a]|uniref:hypothetical protein n=1 Tax=Paraburkholderia sp. RAU6.4a TaxID=2991067 RepID=UPI003D1BD1D2
MKLRQQICNAFGSVSSALAQFLIGQRFKTTHAGLGDAQSAVLIRDFFFKRFYPCGLTLHFLLVTDETIVLSCKLSIRQAFPESEASYGAHGKCC